MTVRDPVRAAIADMGGAMGPTTMARITALFDEEQNALAGQFPPLATDVAYGPHDRHRLDVYGPAASGRPAPVLIWVHGGGYTRGDKGGGSGWTNANVGRMAAQAGWVGVVINYRLAPQNPWPAGAEDLAAAIAWAKSHAADYDGDPHRIVLAGTSAGAGHVAGYIKLQPRHGEAIRGAVLLSGPFGFVPLTEGPDFHYYGSDTSLHAERQPLEALVATDLPLFVACAQFDPLRFQQDFMGLLQRRLERHGRLPRSYIASGHNHLSLAYHLGTSDTRVRDEIIAFVDEVCS